MGKAKKGNKGTITQKKSPNWTNSFQGLGQSGSETNGRLDSDGDTPMDGAAEDPWESGGQPTQYTLPQRKTTTRIRQCDEHDYYGILGLKKGCSLSDIRKAYRDLALRTHPDHNKFEDAEIAFKSESGHLLQYILQCYISDYKTIRARTGLPGSPRPLKTKRV